MDIEQVAQIAHETNRAYCSSIGDPSQKPWDDADEWQRESAIKGVQFRLNNPHAKESSQHDAWMQDKYDDGWKYGPEKDAGAKTHPCMVAYRHLPMEQRLKDYLFVAIVSAFERAEQESPL